MRKERIKRIVSLEMALMCMAVMCTGCGQETTSGQPGDIELIEPVGAALHYEAAARKNLYDAKVYSAVVCPHVEEYALQSSCVFDAYDSFPGQEVKKGAALLHADTDDIEKQIEELEKSIAAAKEGYQEYVTDTNEALINPRAEQENNGEILENLEEEKPEQYITVPGTVPGETIQETNPAYVQWENTYRKYEGQYRKALQSVNVLEEALRQKTELYELDSAHRQLQLERLKADKGKCTLASGMSGYVVAMRLLSVGSWMGAKSPLMAVGDLERPELRCEYIAKSTISNAEDVYAIINGKRYEVEYQPLSTEEYRRLEELNGKVYSTFRIQADAEEITMGGYAVIVVVNQSREDVIAVPKDSVSSKKGSSYVYVVQGRESVYAPVTTGMSDGVYTEILSGVCEGDKVLTGQAVTAGSDTVKVEKGEVHYDFSSTGFLTYPTGELVVNSITYGTCYYVERLVSRNQQVKKGEVLARIRVVPDEVELERNEQKLQRERERLADLKALGEEENKKAIAAKEETITELEKLIADMQADFAVTEIKSPINGIITEVYQYDDEALVQKDAKLFLVSDETLSYIFVEDENGQLTYGNQVSVTYTGADGQEHHASGTVVTLNQTAVSSDLVPEASFDWNSMSTGALIMVSPEDVGDMAGSTENADGWWNRNSFKVTVPVRSMENILVVPKKAVTMVAGRTYVRVRTQNGEIQYCSFIAGGSDSVNYWVVEGLTEGMELCLE